MRYIKYLMLVIASLMMTTACTDDEPAKIATIENPDVKVTLISPTEVEISLTASEIGDSRDIRVVLSSDNGDWSNDTYLYNNDYTYSRTISNLNPNTTYNYRVIMIIRDNEYDMQTTVEIATGSFTTPSEEEYFNSMKEYLIEKYVPTLDVISLTNHYALFTISYPDSMLCRDDPKLIYSSYQDFSGSIEVDERYDSYYNKYIYSLTGLSASATYYVKLTGRFRFDELNSSMRNKFEDITLTLSLNPNSFTTLSNEDIINNAKCTLTETYVIDTEARLRVALPSNWSFYKEYSNDPASCEVIYSTNPDFSDYSVCDNASLYDTKSTLTLTDLTPATTYYVGLKGNFYCDQTETKLLDFILPCDNTITTTHANQIEMIDGYPCVDLGLSVKWATENLKDGDEEYFSWPSDAGLKDIAGSEFDHATQLWGARWQTPSEEQFNELLTNTKRCSSNDGSIYIAPNGNYIKITSKGYMSSGSSYNIYNEESTYYWTSTESSSYRNYATCFRGTEFSSMRSEYRLPIRPVTAK